MGLDDFIDDDSYSSSSNTQTSTQSNDTDSIERSIDSYDMQFYGHNDKDISNNPIEREKALSDYSMSDAIHATSGEIEFETDDIKLHMPVFYLITPNPKYAQGEHYQLKYTKESPHPSWHNRVVSCVGSFDTALSDINKEVIMLALTEHDKGEVMDSLKSMLDQEVNGDELVYVSTFGDMFMLRDLAQANNEFREGDLINRDKIMHQVMSANTLASRVNNKK